MRLAKDFQRVYPRIYERGWDRGRLRSDMNLDVCPCNTNSVDEINSVLS